MIEPLKSERVDNSLLYELAAHPDFPRLMTDLEIYVNGVVVKQVQTIDEAASPNNDPEQASLAFICKRLRLNFKKLYEEEKNG